MPEAGVRVALLGRAGDAREQLRRALLEAGADVVAEGDPADVDPGTVASRQPGVVVVSLEPAIEDALAPFDDLLAMPGVQVIYDDAEVTSKLDGWDLARWARHLAAKLAGSGVVLPPAPADAEHMPEAEAARMPSIEPGDIQLGAPPTPAQEMDHHRLEDYAAESHDLSEWVPATPSLTDVEVEASPAEEPSPDLELDLDLDLAGLEQAMTAPPPEPEATSAPEPDLAIAAEPALDLSLADEPALDLSLSEAPALDLSTIEEPLLDLSLAEEPVQSMSFGDRGAEASSSDDEPDLGDFLDLSVTESFEHPPESAGLTASGGDEPLLVDFDLPEGPVSFSSFGGDDDLGLAPVDDEIAALAAQLEANEGNTRHEEVREPDFARVIEDDARPSGPTLSLDEPARGAPAAAAAPPAKSAPMDFGSLELAPMDGPTSAPPGRPAPPPDEPVKVDFGGLSLLDDDTLPVIPKSAPVAAPAADFSGLSLEGEGPPVKPAFAPAPAAVAARRGALLVLAGLGGPDGVRQLLSALPAGLPVPVLLYQHLDTGKHDRLVGQLAKASRLPVDLAEPGQDAKPGRVAVLPPGIGVEARGDGFAFVSGSTLPALVAALPAADSAVLVLSGGDPAVVPAVQKLKSAGGHVFAQDPSSCFDAVAPQALVAAGATTAPVAGLASQITDCWS